MFERGVLREYLFEQGCRHCGRGGRSKLFQNAAGTRRTSFPRRPKLTAEDVRRICQRLGVPTPGWAVTDAIPEA